jgi:hypothetical protein
MGRQLALLGIEEHDIVIASRSIHRENAAHYLQKLNQASKRYVYISAPVGHGPRDMRLLEYTGRTHDPQADDAFFYNVLRGLKIHANVASVEESYRRQWKTEEDAFEDQRWMFDGMTTSEERKIKEYLRRNLSECNGQLQLPYDRACCWAVMWWKKA